MLRTAFAVVDPPLSGMLFAESVAESAADAAVHEVGHTLGLRHAPCGDPPAPDPKYPYANAAIGVQGFEVQGPPPSYPRRHYEDEKDFMGYCETGNWISDYHYAKIADRLLKQQRARVLRALLFPDHVYRVIEIRGGRAYWGETVELEEAPHDHAVKLTVANHSGGKRELDGFRLSTEPANIDQEILVPDLQSRFSDVSFTIGTANLSLKSR